MSEKDNVLDFSERYAENQRQAAVDGVAADLGVELDDLADMVGSSTDDMRDAFVDCIERNMMYRAVEERQKERERKQNRDPDECHNAVCSDYVSCEEMKETIDGHEPALVYYETTERKNFCKEGRAQNCIFRLLEQPSSDPFVEYPSYNECVRILQRIGYIRSGDFGEELGTNFMFHTNTGKLWVAYVLLLVETGRVELPEDEYAELKELHEENHAKYVCGIDLAKAYFRDRSLPDTVATVSELVAQRNALLQFIRGEINWPDGRCPCGSDYYWDGKAHSENCRLKGDK